MHAAGDGETAKLSRFRGALLGTAVGDAVGTTLEFKPPGTFEPIDDMVGGGPFGLEPGQWTDDTSMALCLAESIVETGGFNPVDQLRRYCRWWREGHLSSTGAFFDIGRTISGALTRFEQTGDAYCGSTDENTAGNGSVMRLAPVPMAWCHDPETAIHIAGESSRTTHQHPAAIDGCRYLAALIVGAIQGRPKDELLGDRFSPVPGHWDCHPLEPRIDAIARGSFKHKDPPDIRGTGFVVHSLEAALWAFNRADDFREGCLLAANLGDDADTTAAVYGQLAGAFWGEEGIPAKWRERLAMGETIRRFADRLHAFAEGASGDQADQRIEIPKLDETDVRASESRGERVPGLDADHPRDLGGRVTMLGAIAGDIFGAVFEGNPLTCEDFDLFEMPRFFTDDTVLTVATADAILTDRDYGAAYMRWGRRFPNRGYGGSFRRWLSGEIRGPYSSFGNGSAMRVSPVGWAFDTLDETLTEATRSASVTHDHPEGIKGAQAVAAAIFLARNGAGKEEIRTTISDWFGYDLDRTVAGIRPHYSFDVTCQGSVPEALIAFLDADDFEHTLRLAISLGGDADTQAAIAGSVAEAFWGGVPERIETEVRLQLDGEMLEVIERFAVRGGH